MHLKKMFGKECKTRLIKVAQVSIGAFEGEIKSFPGKRNVIFFGEIPPITEDFEEYPTDNNNTSFCVHTDYETRGVCGKPLSRNRKECNVKWWNCEDLFVSPACGFMMIGGNTVQSGTFIFKVNTLLGMASRVFGLPKRIKRCFPEKEIQAECPFTNEGELFSERFYGPSQSLKFDYDRRVLMDNDSFMSSLRASRYFKEKKLNFTVEITWRNDALHVAYVDSSNCYGQEAYNERIMDEIVKDFTLELNRVGFQVFCRPGFGLIPYARVPKGSNRDIRHCIMDALEKSGMKRS